MAAWLVTNFLWVGILLVILVVGSKLAIGAVLKGLMDRSAADAARRSADAGRRDDRLE
ncbi:hypothetical protein [Thioalkalivibrio sp.]|uniref:hypothetical protein n=1 Tax=Thioalkalivibrio sp. TaxID=2093813 RepID=UPI003975302A